MDTIEGIEVYLEREATRQFVGRLTRDGRCFVFDYSPAYLKGKDVVFVGPELPLTRRQWRSETLFPSFVDRLPCRENPAYPEYCSFVGIDVEETDPFILLATLGKRGPSSLIFEPLYYHGFGREDLCRFRKKLGLSTREFATLFQFSQPAITRVELGQSSGRELLKRVEIYVRFPEVVKFQLHRFGGAIHPDKRKRIMRVLSVTSVERDRGDPGRGSQ